MYISKILIDLCLIRQSKQLKSTFADTIYNALVKKGFYENIKVFKNKWYTKCKITKRYN